MELPKDLENFKNYLTNLDAIDYGYVNPIYLDDMENLDDGMLITATRGSGMGYCYKCTEDGHGDDSDDLWGLEQIIEHFNQYHKEQTFEERD